MDFIVCFAVSIVCAFFGLFANSFFAFCLIFPPGGKMNIKYPLKTLIVHLILSTSFFQLGVVIYFSLTFTSVYETFKTEVQKLTFFGIRLTIPPTLFMNIYYCTQIVTMNSKLFMWLKKNFIGIWIFNFIFVHIYFLMYYPLTYFLPESSQMSNTTTNMSTLTGLGINIEKILAKLDYMTTAINVLGLILMLSATGTTVHYLYHHIKKMIKSGKNKNSQTLKNQIRVTMTGLFQGLLYTLCAVGMFLDTFCHHYGIGCNQNVIWIIFSIYSLTTELNMGIGQNLFRQKALQLCKTTGDVVST